jgi:ribulose-bisphosphate carboxylase large chain
VWLPVPTERVVATYRIASYLPLEQAGDVLAGEQSSGTFAKVALESESLNASHRAQVVEVLPDETEPVALPGTWRPEGSGALHAGLVRVSFPVQNFGASVAALLTVVAGNLYEIRELAEVKLVDVEIPEQVRRSYRPPLWGTAGTRELLGTTEGPMVGTIVKPSIGLSLEQLAALVRDLALAGIDFIKDDELSTDPPFAPLAERIRVVMREINAAAQVTGKQTMYAFNITDDLEPMKRSADLIAEQHGTCAMVAIPWVGFPALADLRRHSDLVLHGHRAGFGALDRSPGLGMSFTVFQKLSRLCGADHLHVGGVNSKFWESNEAVIANVRALGVEFAGTPPVLPVLSSAQTAATAQTAHDLLRTEDLLVLAGGGIHAHPGGVAAGVHSMQEAWRAVTAGQDPADVATPGSALDVALSTFGGSR